MDTSKKQHERFWQKAITSVRAGTIGSDQGRLDSTLYPPDPAGLVSTRRRPLGLALAYANWIRRDLARSYAQPLVRAFIEETYRPT